MEANLRRSRSNLLLNLFVGIEVGLFGAVLMLIWFALISPVLGQPWWLIPNMFASHFYPIRHIREGAGIVTFVGIALHLLSSGIVGAMNGVLTPGGRLFGLGLAIAWYLTCYFYLWKRMAPLLTSHASQPVLIAGWFLFGSMLGWHPWFVERTTGPEASAS